MRWRARTAALSRGIALGAGQAPNTVANCARSVLRGDVGFDRWATRSRGHQCIAPCRERAQRSLIVRSSHLVRFRKAPPGCSGCIQGGAIPSWLKCRSRIRARLRQTSRRPPSKRPRRVHEAVLQFEPAIRGDRNRPGYGDREPPSPSNRSMARCPSSPARAAARGYVLAGLTRIWGPRSLEGEAVEPRDDRTRVNANRSGKRHQARFTFFDLPSATAADSASRSARNCSRSI